MTSRYHSPSATPPTCPSGKRARPSTAPHSVSGVPLPIRPPRPPPATAVPLRAERMDSSIITTFSAISAFVTLPWRPAAPPPKAVRAGRTLRRPSATHSGHWWPTEASRMHSVQIGRSHRLHRM